MHDGWVDAVLGDVADITIGRTPPRDEARYWTTDLTRPFCTIADMDGGTIVPRREGVTEGAELDGKAKRMPAGSLLLSFKLTIGRVGIAGVDLFPNEAIARVEPTTAELDKHYLALWLSGTDIQSSAGRAVMGNTLNSTSLRAIPVSYPPLADQQRIADLIGAMDDHATICRHLDLTATTAYHALLDRLYQEASADGPLAPLGDVAATRLGKMLDAKRLSGDVYPYLANVNVQWDEVRTDDLRSVPLTDRERDELTLVAGDVLVCEGGEAGRTAVLSHDMPGVYFQKAVHRVRCGPLLRPRYLMHFMRYATRNGVLDEFLSAVTIQHLTGEKLRRVPVPIPPVTIQDDMSAMLDVVSALGRRAADCEAATGSARGAILAELLSGGHDIPASYDRFLDGAA